MTKLNVEATREKLQAFDFRGLFIDELGWSKPASGASTPFSIADQPYERVPVAALGGVTVFEIKPPNGEIPATEKARKKVLEEVAKHHHENLLIFVDAARQQSVWVWGKRDGTKLFPREHYYQKNQPGDLFLPKLSELYVDFAELDAAGGLEVTKVAQRLKAALDVERVTKKFFLEYEQQHLEFLDLIKGIANEKDKRWYASVLLNRLMFIYFLQKKGFLDQQDFHYLRSKFEASQARGRNLYYEEFLKPLFFEGFAKPADERSPDARALLGDIRYLNGGLFLQHRIELENPNIRIPDQAFANLLRLFDTYSWHLDDTPGGQDNEINPDVLGYIFEKYINQKAFGAYYTRPEITEYLCEQTLNRLILDRVNALPGNDEHFESIGDMLLKLDAYLCRSLKDDILPRLSILDPACGSGAFLVAALKTLIYVYSGVTGRIPYLKDANLKTWYDKTHRDHPSLLYFVKKQIITNNLFGVDIMEEAAEIAKLRLFLALVSSVHSADELEPLPNIDFNILTGNSLIGLLHVDSAAFAKKHGQGDMFSQADYQQKLAEKNRLIQRFRQDSHIYGDDLRLLRDEIDAARQRAIPTLDGVLLDQFQSHDIKFEQATWDLKKNQEGKPEKRLLNLDDIRALQPFHWGYEFDRVIAEGGFDAILTNPPWETLKPQAKEFFADHSDLVTKNKMSIKDFEKEQAKLLKDPELRRAWLEYLSRFPHVSLYFRGSPQYRNQIALVKDASGKEKRAGTDVNLYKLFLEQAFNLLKPDGRCGILVPTGFYSDLGSKQLREMMFSQSRIQSLFGLSNEKYLFDGVHHSFRFCVLTWQKGAHTETFEAAFRINPREAISVERLNSFLRDRTEHLSLAPAFIRQMSPDSVALVEFKGPQDVAIAEKTLTFPAIGDDLIGSWNLRLGSEFHMTGDSDLFLQTAGAGRLPLFEGKMIHQFESQFAAPKYWLQETAARKRLLGRSDDDGQLLGYQQFRLAFRDVARDSDERTLISTILPPGVFCPHTITLEDVGGETAGLGNPARLLVLALLNSFVVDYFVRQRVTAHVSLFILYSLRVPRLDPEEPRARALISRAARLVCIRPEFATLWRDVMGAEWKLEDVATSDTARAGLRAEIDALVAHVFNLGDADFRHILSTFPVVRDSVKLACLESYRAMTPKTTDQELGALLLGGEGPRAEYKSTVRWDLKKNEKNGDLERVIQKTIAGFLNAQGGTLLIGVDDDGKAVGLHHDYQTLQKKNRDGFGLLLGDLIFGAFGKDLAPCVEWHFHQLAEVDVCRIVLRPSPSPVFLLENNDHVFYLRVGNATKKLNAKEAIAYEKTRFGPGPTPTASEVHEGPALSALGPSKASDKGAAASEALAMSPLFKSVDEKQPTAKTVTKKPKTEDEAEPRLSIQDIDRDDSLCAIRELFGTPGASAGIERDEALRQLCRALGFERLGTVIRGELDNDLRTAVHRSILVSEKGLLRLGNRTIAEYTIDELKDQLVAAVGNVWTDREDAIRAAARRLGFQRAGSRIQDAFKSAINGALRTGRIEASGLTIRRRGQ